MSWNVIRIFNVAHLWIWGSLHILEGRNAFAYLVAARYTMATSTACEVSAMENLCCKPCNLILYPSLSTVWLDPEVFPFFFVNGAAALVGVRCRNARVFKNRIRCLLSILKTKSWCIIVGNLSKNLSLDIQLLDRTFIAATSVSCIPGSASLTWLKPVGGLCMLTPSCELNKHFIVRVSFFHSSIFDIRIFRYSHPRLMHAHDSWFLPDLPVPGNLHDCWWCLSQLTSQNDRWRGPLIHHRFGMGWPSWTQLNCKHFVSAACEELDKSQLIWAALSDSNVKICMAGVTCALMVWSSLGGRLLDIQEFLMWVFMQFFEFINGFCFRTEGRGHHSVHPVWWKIQRLNA